MQGKVDVAMLDIRLELPYPPSANRYWRSFKNSKTGRVVHVVSEEAKSYKFQVALHAHVVGIKKPITGRVFINIVLSPPEPKDAMKRKRLDPETWDNDVRCVDLDNTFKILCDSLRGVAYVDDKWIRRIVADRVEPSGDGYVLVHVGAV
jgi:crossover junction endodeoxyribonuclease RusA